MPRPKKRTSAKPARTKPESSVEDEVQSALTWLKRHATRRTLEGMARYGIPSDHALGVSVADIRLLGKQLGRNHELAAALWKTGCYEARMLTSFVDEPARVTSAQMDRWCRDFDNWGICDTLCFHLFDRTPFAWKKAVQWPASPREFVKRAGFALMASLVVHDKAAPGPRFLAFLPLIEQGAQDERNFVKKGANWALRCIGKRDPALNLAARAVAKRLALSKEASCRWVGKDALRELASPKVRARLARP
ncbi:MAG TPA: DNA alkylation repair protein [Chthoniobacterales bacterium]|nr:DNA alkylation repair protein [Chthoniobacterales bacterium]